MDLFRVLGAGARFDKKRFRDDVEVFHAPRSNDATLEKSKLEDNVVADLDFFGTSDAKDPVKTDNAEEDGGPKSKRRKLDVQTESTPEEEYAPFKNEEEVNIYRKQNRIRIYGTDVPHPLKTFAELSDRFKLRKYLRKNLDEAGYNEPTPIQKQAVPIMLHAREIMACAPTGSGKTLAYLLPILQDLKGPAKEGFRALFICPTRELAQQIHRELKKLCQSKPFKICVLTKTNVSNDNVAASLQNFDILISTPLRLVHGLQHESIKLSSVRHLVLDEADKLLELGFLEQVDEIMASCTNDNLQKALFSATIPSGVEALAKSFMKDPVRVVIGAKNAATETINQKLLYVGQEEGKLIAIRQLIQQGLRPPVLIFVQSIERAKELFHELVYDGINVDVIHSERTKAQRDAIIQSFRLGRTWVLIATELMARGIDFKGVNLVINYDFPQSVQSYIHRIGRTGRAGRKGEAITYFTREDGTYLKSVVNVMRESGCEVPEWMEKIKGPSKKEKKILRKKPVEREGVATVSKFDVKRVEKKRMMIEASKRRKATQEGANSGESK
ncbi:RNA-dependent ATPase rok1 [Rhizophlyctis rosea]|uniref:RNA helicase n=1 Tax=Rhizophlyctis rosea TaxID=64517 RepID=A0AAD5S579_9FUNG|nr:RNA-dependent ATPase rok1 [Rhizophlyctis rosea]